MALTEAIRRFELRVDEYFLFLGKGATSVVFQVRRSRTNASGETQDKITPMP